MVSVRDRWFKEQLPGVPGYIPYEMCLLQGFGSVFLGFGGGRCYLTVDVGTWLLFPFSKKANVGELEGSIPSVAASCTVRYSSDVFAYREGATIVAAVINQSGKCQ